MSSSYLLFFFLLLLNSLSIRGQSQKGCTVKHAYYNIVCSRFEFWCSTKRNVLTYEAICKYIILAPKTTLNLNNPKDILDIEIYNSNVTTLTQEMFADYTNLQRLYIQQSNTKEIQGNAFKGNVKLDWMILKNNSISLIQPKAFVGLSKLNVMNFNQNNLSELNDYTFEGLVSLQYLSLKENRIATIQDNTFSSLKKLGVLFLNDNLITKISDKLFVNNVGLRITWFNNNKIETFADNYFKNKNSLSEVILNNNKLVSVNYAGFSGNISMNHNNLQKLVSFGKLLTDSFDISFNNISYIPANVLSSSDDLTTLLLNNNSIIAIHEDAFRNLTKLKTLRLDNNQIFELSLGLFQDLRSLESLNISYNQIQIIKSGTFTGLINLQFLELSNNKISAIQSSSLYPLKQLKTFYFNDNSLKSIETDNLISHLVTLREINLDNNNWNCDWLSSNLIKLDAKNIAIVHGSTLKTSNVHGIFCDNSDFDLNIPTSNFNFTLPPEPMSGDSEEETSIERVEIKIKNPENAQHSTENSSSGTQTSTNVGIAFGVLLFVGVACIVVKKFIWKKKLTLRRVHSNDTISYKLDLVDDE